MPRRCDIWRVGIVRDALPAIVAAGSVPSKSVVWLPAEPAFRFLADPFGLWRDGRLHVFAEAYDYRTRRGHIDWLVLDEDLRVADRRTVLREPWHLSYPYVFEAEGETWMLPEASRSGGLTLYRAEDFPTVWTPTATIALDPPPLYLVPIDATPVFHDGRWWLLFAGGANRAERMGTLHVAWADELAGPWRLHPANPVRRDIAGARPAGTPFVEAGLLRLPVQDSRATYGGAVRVLTFHRLTPDVVETEVGEAIAPPAADPAFDGFHTLSAAGPVTLLDVKRIDRSGRGWLIDLGRQLRRLAK